MAFKDNGEILAAKQDLSFLKDVLGVHSDRTSSWGSPCPCCQGSTSMQWGPDKKKAGEWYWHCNKCGLGGDVVDALVKVKGLDFKGAFQKIREQYGPRVRSGGHPASHPPTNGTHPQEPTIQYGTPRPEPVLDHDLAEKYIAKHHDYLLQNPDLVRKWQRGISEQVIKKYRLGFIEMDDIPSTYGTKMFCPGAWLIPITDEDGKLRAARIHFEERPHWNSGECPKILWAPWGTQPAYSKQKDDSGRETEIKPVHSYYGLWPHPLTLRRIFNQDFSMTPEWYMKKLPADNIITKRFEETYEAEKLQAAFDLSVKTDDLETGQLWQCKLRAFDVHKKKIMAVVMDQSGGSPRKRMIEWKDYIFLCPGELKALAAESMGLMATAPTGGEGWMATEDDMAMFAGQNVCIFRDDDPPKRVWKDKNDHAQGVLRVINAGLEWAKKWSLALQDQKAAGVVIKSGGQKVNNND